MSFPIASTKAEWAHLTGDGLRTVNEIWLVEMGEYEQTYIAAAFTSEELANEYVAERDDGRVTSVSLFDRAPVRIPLYVRGADVYPDGKIHDWTHQELWDEPGPPDLSSNMDPWDGHTQGHCGLHVYVSGGDLEAVEAEFQRHVALAVTESDGTCHSCGRTGPFQTGFWGEVGESRFVGQVTLEDGTVLAEAPGYAGEEEGWVTCDYQGALEGIDVPPNTQLWYQMPRWVNEEGKPIAMQAPPPVVPVEEETPK